jgi:hypothetical protein
MSQSFYGISTGDNDNNGANNVYYRSLTQRCEGDNCKPGGSGYYYGGDSYVIVMAMMGATTAAEIRGQTFSCSVSGQVRDPNY